MKISKQRKLTKEEEVNLDRIDKLITKIMLSVEKKINSQQHNSPWSPELHDSIRIVSIWKSIYQLITKIMLRAEKKINNQQHNSPWSPELHDSIRTVSVWKSILSQFKTSCRFKSKSTFIYHPYHLQLA